MSDSTGVDPVAPEPAAAGSAGGRRGASSRRGRLALIAGALAVLLVGYGTLDAYDRVPGILTTAPPLEVQELPQLSAEPVSLVEAASPLSDSAPVPQAVGERLQGVFDRFSDDISGRYGYEVRDVLTGDVLAARSADTAQAPASVTKVVTGAGALAALDPGTRFATRTVLAEPASDAGVPQRVLLVGGGDVLLGAGESDPDAVRGHAGLATLAQQTALSLAAEGISHVTLEADLSRYTGDPWHENWDRGNIESGYITAIQPLMQNAGAQHTDERYPPLHADPAAAALESFAGALTEAGAEAGLDVEVAGTDATAPADATELGRVESAPLSAVVEYMLVLSENVVAEVLGREVALALGHEATSETGAPSVVEALERHGIDTGSIDFLDSSGMDYGNRISAHDLTSVLQAAAAADDGLSLLIPSLPVAGVSGTMMGRFQSDAANDGEGVVTAKTGSLATVSSLAGTVLTQDGRLLAFSILADELERGSAGSAHYVIDAALAELARCGCS